MGVIPRQRDFPMMKRDWAHPIVNMGFPNLSRCPNDMWLKVKGSGHPDVQQFGLYPRLIPQLPTAGPDFVRWQRTWQPDILVWNIAVLIRVRFENGQNEWQSKISVSHADPVSEIVSIFEDTEWRTHPYEYCSYKPDGEDHTTPKAIADAYWFFGDSCDGDPGPQPIEPAECSYNP